MITKGQIVKFKPEYMDQGDEDITFLAVSDQYADRVEVEAQIDLPFKPRQIVKLSMIETTNNQQETA